MEVKPKLKGRQHFDEKTIAKFGTGAKIDAPKDSIYKRVYVLIRKN